MADLKHLQLKIHFVSFYNIRGLFCLNHQLTAAIFLKACGISVVVISHCHPKVLGSSPGNAAYTRSFLCCHVIDEVEKIYNFNSSITH
jgi:hypothetical protein